MRLISSQVGTSYCTSCGMEVTAIHRLQTDNNILHRESEILRQRLMTASCQQQTLEARFQGSEQAARLVPEHQRTIEAQREEIASLNMASTIAHQSLQHEFKLHAVTERELASYRASTQLLALFLDKLEVSAQGTTSVPEDFQLGKILQEHATFQKQNKILNERCEGFEEQLEAAFKDLQDRDSRIQELQTANTARGSELPVTPNTGAAPNMPATPGPWARDPRNASRTPAWGPGRRRRGR